jgi:predicted P-loop ATPase
VADNKVVNLPIPATSYKNADEHARAETERNQRLFAWADALLKRLGLDKAVARAKSIEELRSVTFNVDSVEVALAIRDALHPASGNRAGHFRGLKEGGLKQILKNRFTDLKKTREAKLRRGRQPDWTDDLILDKHDKIKPNLANLTLMLREAPAWKGMLAFDEFNARVVIKAPKASSPLGKIAPNTPWTDHHESQVRVWFQRKDINPTMGDVGRAVAAAARTQLIHPVRSFFEELIWDGTPRLQNWPQEYLHVEDSEYVRAVGPRYLISGVARIYQPGCQADHMFVLEGPQGKFKSTALRVLAINDAWFADRLSHVATKDASIETAGVFIFEIAELEGLLRATVSAQKSFISRRYDRYRPPWARYPIRVPRQCIFAGTINPPPDADGRYLKDATGARRFWPATCRGMIDIAGLLMARDQLWAEAVHLFKAGAPWWLETPELEALATAEQAKRYAADPWEEPIREWLGDHTDDVSLWDVLKDGLGFDRKQQEMQSVQKRVVKILTRLGFRQHRPRTPEGRTPRYRRDPSLKKMTT